MAIRLICRKLPAVNRYKSLTELTRRSWTLWKNSRLGLTQKHTGLRTKKWSRRCATRPPSRPSWWMLTRRWIWPPHKISSPCKHPGAKTTMCSCKCSRVDSSQRLARRVSSKAKKMRRVEPSYSNREGSKWLSMLIWQRVISICQKSAV